MPSPGSQLPPRLQNRHGHRLSLAHPHPPPPFLPSFYNPAAAFNPFGPSAVLGSDSIQDQAVEHHVPSPIEGILAPQGRVPVSISSLAPPSISRGSSRPDFVRGFGIDIPEEEEPQEEEPHPDTDMEERSPDDEDGLGVVRAPSQPNTEPDGATTVAQSTLHSRHVSRLSRALSLYSVGGIHDSEQVDMVPIRSPVGNPTVDDLDKEAVGEWTGSEDVRLDSDDEVGLPDSQRLLVVHTHIFPGKHRGMVQPFG